MADFDFLNELRNAIDLAVDAGWTTERICKELNAAILEVLSDPDIPSEPDDA